MLEDVMLKDSDIEIAQEYSPVELQKTGSAFGYYGSKQKIAGKIIEFVPPHNCWVELFCGSAAITLAKNAAPIEIINDINGNIVNVFKQLRLNSEKLIDSIEFTPYSREEYALSKSPDIELDGLERARLFLVKAMMSVNGEVAGKTGGGGFSYSDSYARSGKEARVSRWHNYPKRLAKVAQRLKACRIENFDGLELLGKFVNRPATLVYIDPPYLMDRKAGYENDANDEEFHIKLLNLCLRANCMILISSYENDIYDAYLSRKDGWKKEIVETYTIATCGKRRVRTEVVWRNKQAVKAKNSNRVPIRLATQEKQNAKINPLRNL